MKATSLPIQMTAKEKAMAPAAATEITRAARLSTAISITAIVWLNTSKCISLISLPALRFPLIFKRL